MALTEVGYYQLESLLGEGGMGAVYLGVHRMTGRRYAVKMLRAHLAERPDLNARFFNEARAVSLLEHPAIVRVFDVGKAQDGTAYMVMELCEGPTLAEILRTEPRLRVKLGVLAVVADALAHAHAQGVIHRDLKPDNVIVSRIGEVSQPRVLDFGIAKLLETALLADSQAVKTRTGTAMGTPLYMSPEQCRGVGGITPATDVYALGVMAYEVLRGELPFNGGVGEVIVHHLTTPAPTLDDLTIIDLEVGTTTLVSAMLEKEPAARPTMGEVAQVLFPYIDALTELVVPPPRLAGEVPIVPVPTELATQGATTVDAPRATDSEPEAPLHRSPLPWIALGALPCFALALFLALRRGDTPKPVEKSRELPALVAPRVDRREKTWLVKSVPDKAEVWVDGALVGNTPIDATSFKHGVTLKLPGYDDQLVEAQPGNVSSVHLHRASRRTNPTKPAESFDIEAVH